MDGCRFFQSNLQDQNQQQDTWNRKWTKTVPKDLPVKLNKNKTRQPFIHKCDSAYHVETILNFVFVIFYTVIQETNQDTDLTFTTKIIPKWSSNGTQKTFFFTGIVGRTHSLTLR